MRHLQFLVALTWILFWGHGHAETLTILGDDAYPPIVHLKAGKPAGVLPAILARAEKMTGDRYEIRLSPWKRAYDLAQRGEGGLIGVSYTKERAAFFDYSRPLYDDNILIVTLKGRSFPYSKLSDLKGKVIGGVNGASYGEEVDEAIAKGLFTVERDVSQAGRLRKLLADRLDAAFIGNGQAGFDNIVGSSEELRANRDRFTILPVALTKDPLHLAFAKSMGKRAALDRFDAALEQLQKSGELKRILAYEAR